VATTIKPIRHEDRLSLVEHLDELRTRIIVSLAAFCVCLGVCLWQNDAILDIVNEPLYETAFREGETSKDPFEQQAIFTQRLKAAATQSAQFFRDEARAEENPARRAELQRMARYWQATAAQAPRASPRRPVTLGVGEPFTATIKVAGYAALLLALPIILYQMYAFILPAFSPRERQIALPLMLMMPFLFIAGVVFAYFVVLPNAINFLQNFNDDNFDILLQARDYYRFAILVMIALGLLFQIPVGILAVTRAGIISVRQLRRNRRYAILVIAVLAMLLPGTDPLTMVLSMAPLVVLYEASILLAALLQRREERALAREGPDDDDDLILDDD
jgi:sec-independent protein translocase protein TatC